MSYSVDPQANKENATSPSVYLSMTEQLLYKIAALDASVQSGFRRIDEKMDRFQTDLHESQINLNDRINQLDKEFGEAILFKRQRIDALEKRINELENAISTAKAQFAAGALVVTIIWTLFGPAIRHVFGIPG